MHAVYTLGKNHNSPKAVLCIEKGFVFPSVEMAARFLRVSPTSISEACNGRNKTAFGLHWKFVTIFSDTKYYDAIKEIVIAF